MTPNPKLAPTNILVIEDTASDAELVRAYLEDEADDKFRVFCAPTMKKALGIMVLQKIHAVMLDLFLPDTEDLGGLKSIKTMLPSVPILILTGRDDEDMAFRAVESGAQDYLLKDKVNPRMLRRTIRYAMQRKKYEDKITYQANFDVLTSLPNRLQFQERLEAALSRQQRHSTNLAVIMIDLNGFKLVNDRFGHDAGDAV
ncbi:MAG: diguanylate cyclase, partial [Bdellovibrionales bacterium]